MEEDDDDDDDEFGGQETMVTARVGQADEFTASSESQFSQDNTMIIREDQGLVSPLVELSSSGCCTHAPPHIGLRTE